jgi:two-component system nitrogen regulation response regulator GlnG
VSRILIVDDEPSICWGLSRLVRAMGHRVDSASSAEHGLAVAAAARPDVLILDVRLPGMDGLAAIKSFRLHIGSAPIIVITAFGDLDTAIAAVENGAFEYVVKPFDLADIRAAIERALRGEPPARDEVADGVDGMIGRTPVMQAVFKRIALAARTDASVLLCGESGVGKELAARAIHRHSSRREAAFITVNVAAINPALAEVELFGHVGPLTGQARKGLLSLADGGTLYLDDVADIPLAIQVKLLQALDQGEALPVGGDSPAPVRCRVISATQHNLLDKVQAGEFRHDLYLRLGTYEISLPALGDRREDIRLLANKFAAQFGSSSAALAEETLEELARRPWYGNVRELRNAVEHALVAAYSGAVLPSHLPEPLPKLDRPAAARSADQSPELAEAVSALARTLLDDPTATGGVYERFLEEVEPPLLAAALQRSGNRCAPAARALGLHRTTLKRKLDQYGLDEASNP